MTHGNVDDWYAYAACHGQDTNLFYPPKHLKATAAREFCVKCPVWRECLEYAVTRNEKEGIWGGASPEDRKSIRRERSRNGDNLAKFNPSAFATVASRLDPPAPAQDKEPTTWTSFTEYLERWVSDGTIAFQGDCWIWGGQTAEGITPIATVHCKTVSVRRRMFEHHGGEVPKLHFVKATCGENLCVNPDHSRVQSPHEHMTVARAGRRPA